MHQKNDIHSDYSEPARDQETPKSTRILARSRQRSILTLFFVGLFIGSISAATCYGQTNDPVFRSWRWEEETLPPRAGGLGGAFVGLADDVSTVVLNPAGTTALWAVGEGQVGWSHRQTAESPLGDELRSDSPFFGGLAVRPQNFFAVGFYSYYPRSIRSCLGPCGPVQSGTPSPLPGTGELEAARMDSFIRDLVLAGSLRPRRFQWLSIGAAVNLSWRVKDVHIRRYTPTGEVFPEEHVPGPEKSVAFPTLGVLLISPRGFRGGLSWHPSVRWLNLRKTYNKSYDLRVDLGEYDLVRPGVLSAGVSWSYPTPTPERPPKPNRFQWILTAQLDRVRYSDITRQLVLTPERGSPDLSAVDYQLSDGWEPRAGLEVRWKLIALRGGLHRQSPGALQYVGPDVGERALFPGSRSRNRYATGATVTFPWWKIRRLLNADALVLWRGDQTVLSFAATFRYPVPY